ncbi:MAG: hypothetical protein Q8Q67_01775 [bacterium]|nr:hypothetical protein [bacterium]
MALKKSFSLNSNQRRLTWTMLILFVIAACLLFFFAWQLRTWPVLSPASPALLPDLSLEDKLSERLVASLPDKGEYDELSLLSSPDGLSYAYIVSEDAAKRVVYNGESGPLFDGITFMGFSPDGKHFAYTAKRSEKELAIVNGELGREYDWIFNPRIFTSDSQAFIYKARDSRGDMIVINGKESQTYQRIYDLQLTPEKDYLVFFASKDGELWRGEIPLKISE